MKKKMIIAAEEGLHARPAAELAKAAKAFSSKITMYREGEEGKVYQPKSVLSIMTMAASKGEEIIVEALGEDEAEALETIEKTLTTQA